VTSYFTVVSVESMTLRDLPLDQLQEIIRETERLAGPDSSSVRVLRRELERRLQDRPFRHRCSRATAPGKKG
jgi:hypothetical protein